MKTVLTTIAMLVVGSQAFASGFTCDSTTGYNVQLFNDLYATRKPATLVISHAEATPATLVKAFGEQIRKYNRSGSTQYVVDAVHGKAIVQVLFKEGRETLEAGETVEGQLILVDDEGNRAVHALSCSRYLKGDR